MLFLQQCLCYIDEVPDPDFAQKPSNSGKETPQNADITTSKSTKCNEQPTLTPHFKFLINKIKESGLLTPSQQQMFENAEDADPYSISEVILTLIKQRQEFTPLPSTFHDFLPSLRVEKIGPIIAVTYIVSVFTACYFNKNVRNFIIFSHVFALYLCSVIFRIIKEYGDIKGKKMAAIVNMPSHCNDEFNLHSYFSLFWSKLQIGDQCRRYHQDCLLYTSPSPRD